MIDDADAMPVRYQIVIEADNAPHARRLLRALSLPKNTPGSCKGFIVKARGAEARLTISERKKRRSGADIRLACKQCGAMEGERCRSLTGTYRGEIYTPHKGRDDGSSGY